MPRGCGLRVSRASHAARLPGERVNSLPAEDAIAASDITPATLGPVLIYDGATGSLKFDADGSGSKAPVLIAQLSTGLTLTADDFNVV